jgi:hypothetical protein
MDELLQGTGVQSYIDDIVIGGETREEVIKKTQQILDLLKSHHMKVNMDKSLLEPTAVIDALGYRLSHNAIQPKDDLIAQIRNFQLEDDVKSLRKFLGKLSRPFIIPGAAPPNVLIPECSQLFR